MKQNRLVLACGLGALLAGTQIGTAVSADNPYVDTITNRNLFGLKAPPDPASLVPQVAPPPLPEVKLAGITTLMGTTRAILRVMRPAKPPDPAKEVSLFLTPDGPAEDNVKVLSIDVAHGLVQISNSGTTQTLDIKKDAPKGAAAPPPAPGLPVPGIRPGGISPIPPPTGAPPVTSRPMRTGPGGVVGGGPDQMGSTAAANEPPPLPTNEQQTWAIAVAREAEIMQVQNGQMRAEDMKPWPPNEISDQADQEAMQNPSNNPGNNNTGNNTGNSRRSGIR